MDALRDPQEWLDLHGQRRRLVDAAKRVTLLDHARYYAALVQLANDTNFTILLEHMFQNLFLIPDAVPATPENMGRQSLYWQLLKDIRMAQEQGAAYTAQAERL